MLAFCLFQEEVPISAPEQPGWVVKDQSNPALQLSLALDFPHSRAAAVYSEKEVCHGSCNNGFNITCSLALRLQRSF